MNECENLTLLTYEVIVVRFDYYHLQLLETPIMLASNYGHVEVVKALIGMEADLKATDKVLSRRLLLTPR